MSSLTRLYTPANHQSRSDDCDHPRIFRQLLLTEQQLGANSFKGELGQVIEQTVPLYMRSGPHGW